MTRARVIPTEYDRELPSIASSTCISLDKTRSYRYNRKRRRQPRGIPYFSTPMATILLSVALLLLQPFVSHALLCTTLEEPKLSTFYELLRTTKKLLLCPFTISGDGCDVATPFIYNSTLLHADKRVTCKAGECKISCEMDSHIILKDGKELSLLYMTFERAQRGSIHVHNGVLKATGSVWRNNTNLNQSSDTANRGGGAIRGVDSRSLLRLKSSEFWNNFASYHGGAVYSDGAQLMMLSSTFVENQAKVGGAVYATADRVSSIKNVFASNFADAAPVMYFEPEVIPLLATKPGSLDLACDNDALAIPCNGAFDSQDNTCTEFEVCNSPSARPSQAPSTSMMPSMYPSMSPTVQPTKSSAPSDVPSKLPSILPSSDPSPQPSSTPSSKPSLTTLPTSKPSAFPSLSPTDIASNEPSMLPSATVSLTPTVLSSSSPSESPSSAHSIIPSLSKTPSEIPSLLPSSAHSFIPSLSKTPSEMPSLLPTISPTEMHSAIPSDIPSEMPSLLPTFSPTEMHSATPSDRPSVSPSIRRSESPTELPSEEVISPHPTSTDYTNTTLTQGPTSANGFIIRPTLRPTPVVTTYPSVGRSSRPSVHVSSFPSMSLSPSVTVQPSMLPSVFPTDLPTKQPSGEPSKLPSLNPTEYPSPTPSISAFPSSRPSLQPTFIPSMTPSISPSAWPSRLPSMTPSNIPSLYPSSVPTTSISPTANPSQFPSNLPSLEPSIPPTNSPSESPTLLPSKQPSARPSFQPTVSSMPTTAPTSLPTEEPTLAPSIQPTSSLKPSHVPTVNPSGRPTFLPTTDPSSIPSSSPSVLPTFIPSSDPTSTPSANPSFSMSPSANPSQLPSIEPSISPTPNPTMQPSGLPSLMPTSKPTSQPTSLPSNSVVPSLHPSLEPTGLPTSYPSVYPSVYPSRSPSKNPSDEPSSIPTTMSSKIPSTFPSRLPSSQPTTSSTLLQSETASMAPTLVLTASAIPSEDPSVEPTSKASSIPTISPTSNPTQIPSRVSSDRPSSSLSSTPSDLSTLEPSLKPSLTSQLSPAPSGQLISSALSDQPSSCRSSIIYETFGEQLELGNSSLGDRFGYSVSLSEDGNILAVSAPLHPEGGSVRVYERNQGEQLQLKGQVIENEIGFGTSLELSDDGLTLVVGMPDFQDEDVTRVYRYYANLGIWEQLGEDIVESTSDLAGFAVSISGDGNVIAIGDHRYGNNEGCVRVYEFNSVNWVLRALPIVGSYVDAEFGRSVSLSRNGNIVVCGGPRESVDPFSFSGSARVLKWNAVTSQWENLGQVIESSNVFEDRFGFSVSISDDETNPRLAVGAPFSSSEFSKSGSVTVWEYDGLLWNQVGPTIIGNPTRNQKLGSTVSISGDGTRVAVGNPVGDQILPNGKVLVYIWDGDVWNEIDPLIGTFESSFGHSVDLSRDGTTLVVGAPAHSFQGYAQVFDSNDDCEVT